MSTERMEKTGGKLGLFCVFMSSVCFSIGGVCFKFIPWTPMAINAARGIIALVVFFFYLKITHHRLIFNKAVLIGGLAVCLTNTLFAYANKLTTAGNAIVLQYTAPIYVMLFSALIFGKKPTKVDIIAAVVVFAGVVCFFIDGLSAGNMLGNAIALLSGVTYSGVFMLNASEDGDSISSLILGITLNIIIGFPALLKTDFAAASSTTWIAVAFLGVVQHAGAFIFLSTGLNTVSPITACLVGGLEPVLNPILVALLYGEVLSPLSLLGAVIVFGSILAYNVIKAKAPATA